jgi:signal transduction histidine kinase
MGTDFLLTRQVFDSLYRATLTIAGAETLDNVLQQIADSGRDLIGSEYAAIGILDDAKRLSWFITSGIDQQVLSELPGMPSDQGMLTRLTRQRKPIRLSRIDEVPSFSGFPDGHPPLSSFLGVPIIAGTQALGSLYLANKRGADGFSDADERLVEMLAAHAAIAIRKATLLQAHERYGEQLEKRNIQLAALNQATIAITGELTLDKVLQQIVDSALDLAGARYSALGVPGAEGELDTFVYSGMTDEEVARIGHFPKGLGLLGAIIREQRPIRISSVKKDPRSSGFPQGHPPMDSFLGAPLMAGGHMLGNLYLTNKIGANEFSADDQELVEMLAAHAAIVIQNSRLYEQVGRLAIIAERARIGMDLHDGIIQSIYAVGLTLESARLTLPDENSEADHLLGGAIEGLNETIRDIRNFILDLRPHRFSGNLEQGIARLVREFQANTMVPVSLDMALDESASLPVPIARAMFLTTQEALANIARHARASSVAIKTRSTDTAIRLSVRDNGRGFDTRVQVQTVGHGLSNMRARAESLQGTFSLESGPGVGTTITLSLPCC